jgi:hypothetical protein
MACQPQFTGRAQDKSNPDLTQSNFGIHEHVAYPKLIPDIWLLSLAFLVRDEWRMRKRE